RRAALKRHVTRARPAPDFAGPCFTGPTNWGRRPRSFTGGNRTLGRPSATLPAVLAYVARAAMQISANILTGSAAFLNSHAGGRGGSRRALTPAASGFSTETGDAGGGSRLGATALSTLRNSHRNRYETETTSRPDRHLDQSPGKFLPEIAITRTDKGQV